MPNAEPGEWRGLAFQKGDRVRTAKTLGARGWTELGIKQRRPNVTGVITDLSNSHGLCFRVDIDGNCGGGHAYYDPHELTHLGLDRPSVWERLGES